MDMPYSRSDADLTLDKAFSMLTAAARRSRVNEICKIRSATEEDIPRIRELYDDLIIIVTETEKSRSPSHEDYRRVLAEISADRGHELLVVEYNGKVAGTMVLLIVPNLSHAASPWGLIENLIIDQKYRRLGLGRLLVEYAISRAGEAGCFKLVLSSDRQRREAHDFYRSMGFEVSAHGFRRFF